MYIIKNAIKSITRNKGRNILICIVALVIATSACVALSIRQASETAKEETLADLSVTAEISYDRTSAMTEMVEDADSSDDSSSSSDDEDMDFSSLSGNDLTLDEYMTYTDALSSDDSYYYELTASLNASGDLTAYSSDDDTDSDDTDSDDTSSEDMPGGDDSSFEAQGDFSITGFSSYDAMLDLFGEDGTCSISDGSMFDEDTDELVCVISDELALYNDLEVGDTITLSNPNYEDETYTLEIVGIYTNSDSSSGDSAFSSTDPANNIYMSYNTLQAIIDSSEDAGNVTTDDDGNETDAALTSSLTFTYVFASADNYYDFEDAVYDLGLSDDYTVSSSDLSAYESSLEPLETLSTMAGWFFLIVLIIGGIILIVLNIFNLRERKYEVGVLTAIGMKKHKVAAQYIYELFMITFVAIILGAVIGATVSIPVTNKLLESQIESSESSTDTLNENFGFSDSDAGSGGDATAESDSDSDDSSSDSDSSPSFSSDSSDISATGTNYIDSVSSATNIIVILELVGVGIILTIVSSLAAMISIMRYEPLKILSSRS